MAKKKRKQPKKPPTAVIVIVILLVIAAVVYLYTVPREKWPEPVRAEVERVEGDWGIKIGKQAESTATVAAAQPEEPAAAAPAKGVSSSGPTPRFLELPSGGNSGLTHWATMGGRRQRNYTMLYDPSVYASYWVAYPLCAAHLGSGRTETWAYDPDVAVDKQTKVSSGSYGVNCKGDLYESNYYARGHQIPNADRNGNEEMMAQTYYSTNMTPQIQNGFNGGIWAKLEAGVRGMVPVGDTLYIVTGAAFRKKGGNEQVQNIVSTRDGKTLPVPNYYWKAVLKVKRDASGAITDAQTIGFWLPHKEFKKTPYTDFTVSVDQIESWTGFDMFPALPDPIESRCESNTSLPTFESF
ncbi:MAG: DNA/RNA non-specific endonuclease [Bacteroidales bacterium]|nr:DNA/RNA non-specific endonuclease [Bacteroidales bacterium]